MKLESITGQTCINKIRVMKLSYLNEKEEKCKYNCQTKDCEQCTEYIPCNQFYVRIKGIKEYYDRH